MRIVNAIGPPSAFGSPSSAASVVGANFDVSWPISGLSMTIAFGVAPERDVARARIAGLPRAQHLRDRRAPLRLCVGVNMIAVGVERLAAEIERALLPRRSVYVRARGQIVLRIDRDVDAVGDDRRRDRRARRVEQLDRARAELDGARIERLGEHEPERRRLEHRPERRPTIVGSPPLTATSFGAAARGRSARVVNENSGSAPSGSSPSGASSLRTNTSYFAPSLELRPRSTRLAVVADHRGHRIDGTVRSDDAERATRRGARAERAGDPIVGERHDDACAGRDIDLAVDWGT